jgi:hypothetical protein
LIEDSKQFRLQAFQTSDRIMALAPHRRLPGGRTPENRFNSTKRRRTIMKRAESTRSVVVSADNPYEKWQALSLLAGSLAMVAWCVVSL